MDDNVESNSRDDSVDICNMTIAIQFQPEPEDQGETGRTWRRRAAPSGYQWQRTCAILVSVTRQSTRSAFWPMAVLHRGKARVQIEPSTSAAIDMCLSSTLSTRCCAFTMNGTVTLKPITTKRMAALTTSVSAQEYRKAMA